MLGAFVNLQFTHVCFHQSYYLPINDLWGTMSCHVQIPAMNSFIQLTLPQNCSTSLRWFAWLFGSGYASLHFKINFKHLKHIEKSQDIWKQHRTQRKSKAVPFVSKVIITWKEPAADYSVWVMTSAVPVGSGHTLVEGDVESPCSTAWNQSMNHHESCPLPAVYQIPNMHIHMFCLLAWVTWTSCCHAVFHALRRWFRNLIGHETTSGT